MEWMADLFLDKVLPFKLHSAPIIFTAISHTVRGIRQTQDFRWPRYARGPWYSMSIFGDRAGFARHDGMLTQEEAKEVACPCRTLAMTIQVIHSPSINFNLCQVNLSHIQSGVTGMHILRKFHELPGEAQEPKHKIRLTASFHSNMSWWHAHLWEWNRVSLLRPAWVAHPDFCCVRCVRTVWNATQSGIATGYNMHGGGGDNNPKELVPIVKTCAVCGNQQCSAGPLWQPGCSECGDLSMGTASTIMMLVFFKSLTWYCMQYMYMFERVSRCDITK